MTRLRALVCAAFCVLICAPALAAVPPQAESRPVEQPDAQVDPPAHVSIVDGVAVLERDGQIDDSPANMPLLSGDRVRTRDGRIEILFADGATLHLDANTTVDFQSDDLVRLLEGRIRLSIPGPLRAVAYRIDTPAGWAQIGQPGEYRLAMLRGQRGEELELAVLRGSADLLTDDGRTALRAGERAYARVNAAPSSSYVFNSASWDAFDRWSEAQRDYRLGVSAQYLPDEVRPYAASFDRYGSWRSDPTHGYVWYPTVSADWRPYYHGRWVSMPSYGWTWVGRERWDWPTHHYGRWGLSGGAWFWIPGRSWGAAWVSWAYAPDYISWSPLGWNNRPLIQINVFSGRNRWHPWTVIPRRHFGAGYVYARAVPFHTFDARTRGLFRYGAAGPDYRDDQRGRPRSAVPIRTAGARPDRAVPRGSSPVYTNLDPGSARVNSDSRRVIVPPSPAASRGVRRDAEPSLESGRTRAMPQPDERRVAPSQRPDAQAAPGARQRSAFPSGRAGAPTESIAAPDDTGRRGVRTAPRVEPRTGPILPQPERRAPSSIDRGTGEAPDAPGWRRRTEPAPQPARGAARDRSMPAPVYDGSRRATPAPDSPPPAYGGPGSERRAPSGSRPPGMRAVPRGGEPAPSSPRPAEARPSGGGRPAESRPGSNQPSARPADRPSPPGARPRSGGDRPSGAAGARRRGGV